MTTQSKIRQVLTNHFCHQNDNSGKKAWFIKGDFDHFKLTNELYGSLICDYLLDWTLEVIEAELKAYQERLSDLELLWNFIGDDMTLYVPPSMLQADDIEQFLWHVCKTIETSFFHRYTVAAISLPAGFFDDVPADRLERMRNQLESMDVVFDFARRQRGYLTLFPGRPRDTILDHVLQVIQNASGKLIPPAGLHLDWICDQDKHVTHTFNEGFLRPPTVSFAASPIILGGNGDLIPSDRRLVFERVSLSCQSALKVCKQDRKRVLIQPDNHLLMDIAPVYQPAGVLALYSPLRWSSERYLRETLYFRQLDRPVLFQFNPVYHSSAEIFSSTMVGDPANVGKYRGNQYGVGLKGINAIFGHTAADCLIGELTWVFSKVMQSALVKKGIPLSEVHIARSADRFTVCCENHLFELSEIEELVHRFTRLFNCVSDTIKISQIRMSLVLGEINTAGCHLFHQLTLTSFSSPTILLGNLDLPLELRQNQPASNLQEASIALECTSFSSAMQLDTCKEKISHNLQTRNHFWGNTRCHVSRIAFSCD